MGSTSRLFESKVMKSMSSRGGTPAKMGPGNKRQGMTLIELLVVLGIIVTIAGMLLFMLNGAREESRRLRTVAQVRRVNQVIAERWEELQLQPINVKRKSDQFGPGYDDLPNLGLKKIFRLNAARERLRLEFPDRVSDVMPLPLENRRRREYCQSSSAMAEIQRRVELLCGTNDWNLIYNVSSPGDSLWSLSHQGAECLYLILSSIYDDEGSALRFFSPSEIGDKDNDNIPEIWDAWGNPIQFLRWAPGFPSPIQSQNPLESPDPFDPYLADKLIRDSEDPIQETYLLYPLVVSAGSDGSYDLAFDFEETWSYRNTSPPNDPFEIKNGFLLGMPVDLDDGVPNGNADNIDNHWDIR